MISQTADIKTQDAAGLGVGGGGYSLGHYDIVFNQCVPAGAFGGGGGQERFVS